MRVATGAEDGSVGASGLARCQRDGGGGGEDAHGRVARLELWRDAAAQVSGE